MFKNPIGTRNLLGKRICVPEVLLLKGGEDRLCLLRQLCSLGGGVVKDPRQRGFSLTIHPPIMSSVAEMNATPSSTPSLTEPNDVINAAVRPWLDLIDTLRAQGVQEVGKRTISSAH